MTTSDPEIYEKVESRTSKGLTGLAAVIGLDEAMKFVDEMESDRRYLLIHGLEGLKSPVKPV